MHLWNRSVQKHPKREHIDSELIKKAKAVTGKIFSALYFEYPVSGGKSGYGMISEYNPQNDSFTHKDMWVESPNDLPE